MTSLSGCNYYTVTILQNNSIAFRICNGNEVQSTEKGFQLLSVEQVADLTYQWRI